ncbi:hypothetical protein MACJ_001653 [Theileria orientalis]|uniref:Protein transport protein SEC20 n=1 Tax=Theileria orientalis TaxID=68886 RepID=A0A976M8R5_THEOR|nr:hypothetical protein MACJ_001653 [Theileria orientalis]
MNSYKSGLSNVFNEKNKKLSEESLIDNMIHELKQLDVNLEELFHISNADLNTHYSIHKFRLKASRRISSYSTLLRNLTKAYESTTSTQQYVKLFTIHQFYNERLMKHKNKLSEWWSRNERRYHALCLSSFVSQISQPDGQTTTSLPSQLNSTKQLPNTLNSKLASTRGGRMSSGVKLTLISTTSELPCSNQLSSLSHPSSTNHGQDLLDTESDTSMYASGFDGPVEPLDPGDSTTHELLRDTDREPFGRFSRSAYAGSQGVDTPNALGGGDMLKVSSRDDHLIRKLKDTRNMMINQINQMDAAESSLLKSSDYILQQQAILNVLKGKFSNARVTFNLVKRRAIKRYGMVRSCYFLFLFSCGFIVLRRFRFFKIFHLGFKVIRYPIKYLSGKSKPVKDVNSELAEL